MGASQFSPTVDVFLFLFLYSISFMLKGHLPRVMYHQVYYYTRKQDLVCAMAEVGVALGDRRKDVRLDQRLEYERIDLQGEGIV